MDTIDHMKKLIEIFEKTKDTKGNDFNFQVGDYMRSMESEKSRHSIVECLQFINEIALLYVCRHPETTRKAEYPNRQVETCKKCGQSRLLWANYQEDNNGEIIAVGVSGAWGYPKK